MRKIYIIVGPTAVGKTALAVRFAKRTKGIILSADSVQVYKNLDIISGKDKDSYGSLPVFLLDIVSPQTSFNVSDYLKEFSNTLSSIPEDATPIVVGGTGFYISALLNSYETVDIKPDVALRKKLEQLSVAELQTQLEKLDSQRFLKMNNSDKNNPRRLIRAIEVVNLKPKTHKTKSVLEGYNVEIIGLTALQKELHERIDERVDKRIKQGAIDEANELFKNYDELAPQIKTASGYKQLFEYLQGKENLEQAIEKWKLAEYNNAKKQMTWFKKITQNWFDITTPHIEERIISSLQF